MQFVSLDDLDDPTARVGRCQSGTRTLVAAVGEDAQNEGPHGPRARVENQRRSVAILDVCGMDGDAQQEAKRVDEDMPLAARDFLARVIALRIDKSPPFGAALALWLSMIAAEGLASRPACSRTSTYSV